MQEQAHSLLSYRGSVQQRKTFGNGEVGLKLLLVETLDL